MKKLLTILLVLGFSQKIASQNQTVNSTATNIQNVAASVSSAATTISNAVAASTNNGAADTVTAANDGLDPAYWDTVNLTDDQVAAIVNGWLDDGTDESDDPSRYNFASFLQDAFFSTTENAISSNLTGFFQGLSSADLAKFLDDDFTTIHDMMNNPEMIRYMSFLWAFYQSLTNDQKVLVNNILTAITNPTTVGNTTSDSTNGAGVFFDGIEMDDASAQQLISNIFGETTPLQAQMILKVFNSNSSAIASQAAETFYDSLNNSEKSALLTDRGQAETLDDLMSIEIPTIWSFYTNLSPTQQQMAADAINATINQAEVAPVTAEALPERGVAVPVTAEVATDTNTTILSGVTWQPETAENALNELSQT